MIIRWLWLDEEQVTTWTDVICASVSPGASTFSSLVNSLRVAVENCQDSSITKELIIHLIVCQTIPKPVFAS